MAKIRGRWQWNEYVPEIPVNSTIVGEISFISCWGMDFSKITLKNDGDGTKLFYQNAFTDNDDNTCYLTDSGALGIYDEYRLVNFGNEYQEIDDELYDIIVANATDITTTYYADITSLTTKKHRVEGEAEVSTQVDENGLTYTHIATNDETTITTITAKNIPVGKIMFFKYRLCDGYYPAGHFGVTVRYKHEGKTKLAVGTRTGGVLNIELAKRHRGWIVGRVNAQSALKNEDLWTDDNTLIQTEAIEIEIAHKDNLDIAYFMTDNLDANLMPIVKEYGDDYYMHQNIEFGCYIDNQWRKINDSMNGGVKQYDPFTPPHLPEHPEEPDPVYHTVQYDLNGHGHGNDLSIRTVKEGKKANKPNDPTIEGYDFKFDGWYTDAQCTSEYDFTAPVTCDLVLYAKWSKITIADKLIRIYENMQKVYDAGYERGKADGELR